MGNRIMKSAACPRGDDAGILDEVIRRKYVEFGVGADKILVCAELSEKFAEGVLAELPSREAFDSNAVRDRLLTLRKRGAAKGGLPRLERAFNGRIISKPR